MRRLKRKHTVWLSMLGLFGLVAVLLAHLYARLNQPYTASVQASQTGGTTQLVYHIDLRPVHKAGTYVAFNYPKGLSLTSTTLVGAGSAEDYTFFAKDAYSWTLAIDVASTPTGNLTESSSYLIRKQRPQTYLETTSNINGVPVTIMTDRSFSNGFSRVAYLTHGNFVATVSLIGDDTSGTGPLQTTFAMVLNSWQWL